MKTSLIDSTIIDFILTHYNTLSLQGKPAILTSEEFDNLVLEAKEYYYEKILNETPIGIEGES
jgi:hypothetical protein